MVEFFFQKIADMFFSKFLKGREEKKRIEKEFEALKRKILYVSLINNLPVLLKEMKDFLIENDLLNDNTAPFFEKHLRHPVLELNTPLIGLYDSKEALEELHRDVYNLKL